MTTLLDPGLTRPDVDLFYHKRWEQELFFRWLKCVLGGTALDRPQRKRRDAAGARGVDREPADFVSDRPQADEADVEMIQFDLLGWVSDQEFDAHIAKLAAAKKAK